MLKRMKQGKQDQTNQGEEQPTEQDGQPETPEEDGPAQVNRLQLVNVATSAQTRKQHQADEEDVWATRQSEAQITPWEEVQPFTEEDETDQTTEGEDSVMPACPRDRHQMEEAQRRDETLKELWEKAKEETIHSEERPTPQGVHRPAGRLDLTDDGTQGVEEECFEEAHFSPLAKHFRSRKTLKKITQLFYWPRVSRDVTKWTRACETCKRHTKATPIGAL